MQAQAWKSSFAFRAIVDSARQRDGRVREVFSCHAPIEAQLQQTGTKSGQAVWI